MTMDHTKTIERILEVLDIIPTNEQIAQLQTIINDVYNSGHEDASNIYDREAW